MSQQALYRKWRSRSFDELVGQPHVVQTLQNAVDSERVAHAYLFCGPRGTGKTSTARILAKVVNCVAAPAQRPCNDCHICRAINDGSLMDLIEIDAASNTQVDKVRDVIVEKINFAPSEARKKVYVIDEVHMLSNSAFNALLKTIEEPPPHAMFVLATTEIHKIPATILSRCQRLDFRRIGPSEIAAHLGWVLGEEGVTAEPEVLELVARQATGSMRDALSLLDQLLSHGGARLTLPQARAALGLASTEAVQGLVDYLLAQDLPGALRLVNRLLDQGSDPRQFLSDVLEQLRALLLTLAGGRQLLNLPESALERLRIQGHHVDAGALVEMIRLFTQAAADLKLGLQPQLPLELAIIESVLLLQARGAPPAPTPSERLADAEEAAAAPLPRRTPPAERAPAPESDVGVESVAAEPWAGEPVAVAASAAQAPAPPPPSSDSSSPPPPPPPPWESSAAAPPRLVREVPRVVEERIATDSEARTLSWWHDHWEEFKAFLARQDEEGKRTALRLKFCEPHAVDEGALTLGFRYTIHLDKVAAPRERLVVERALASYAGSPLEVRCLLVPKVEAAPAAKTKYAEAAEDPVVREALRQGGRLVDVTVPES